MNRNMIWLGLLTAVLWIMPVAQAADEAALIATLDGDAGFEQKQAACRALRQVGTAASVPALARLLGDEKLSHWARYALEPMPGTEAGAALRKALETLGGPCRAGATISLGVRRDVEAIPQLTALLKDADPAIAQAAAGALGRIGTEASARALVDAEASAAPGLKNALAEGLLTAAERLKESGQADAAGGIYNALLDSQWPAHVRMGAFRGRVYARQEDLVQRVIDALLTPETPVFRDMAAQIVSETPGPEATRAYAAALAGAPLEAQTALLRGLADRADKAARPEVLLAANHADKSVRLAALKALGVLGTAEDTALLAWLMASEDADVAAMARASLATIEDAGVDAAIASAIPEVAPVVRAQLLDLLAERRAPQAVTEALAALKTAEPPVRAAAIKALSMLGGADEAPALLALLEAARDAEERRPVETALGAVCGRNREALLPVVREKMGQGTLETRSALLRILAKMGGEQALAGTVAALNDSDADFQREAVRELSEWPTPDALPHLLELAKNPEEDRYVLGLRGYARLARAEADGGKKAEMLRTAMGLAKRPEEQWLVLGTWGTLIAPQTLDAVLPSLNEPAIRNEAAAALISVAGKLAQSDPAQKAACIAALEAVLKSCEEATLRANAQQTLEKIKQ